MDGCRHPGKPTIAWGSIPTPDTSSQCLSTAVRATLSQHLIVTGQQPIKVLIAPKTTIQPPRNTAALSRGEFKCIFHRQHSRSQTVGAVAIARIKARPHGLMVTHGRNPC